MGKVADPSELFFNSPPPDMVDIPKTGINNNSLGLAPRKTHAFCTLIFFFFFDFAPKFVPTSGGGYPLLGTTTK